MRRASTIVGEAVSATTDAATAASRWSPTAGRPTVMHGPRVGAGKGAGGGLRVSGGAVSNAPAPGPSLDSSTSSDRQPRSRRSPTRSPMPCHGLRLSTSPAIAPSSESIMSTISSHCCVSTSVTNGPASSSISSSDAPSSKSIEGVQSTSSHAPGGDTWVAACSRGSGDSAAVGAGGAGGRHRGGARGGGPGASWPSPRGGSANSGRGSRRCTSAASCSFGSLRGAVGGGGTRGGV